MSVHSIGMNHYTDEQLVRLYVDTQHNTFFQALETNRKDWDFQGVVKILYMVVFDYLQLLHGSIAVSK